MRITELLERRFNSDQWKDWEGTTNPKIAPMIRKLVGRELVESLGIATPKLLKIGNADDLDWKSLPPKYVLKCNMGSATSRVFVMDNGFDWIRKRPVVVTILQEICRSWPDVLLVEEFVEDSNNTRPPLDYKLFVFGNFVDSLMVFDRSSERPRLSSYDVNWNRIPMHMNNKPDGNDIPKPAFLDNMLSIASKIGGYFGTFLRVDLYESTRGVLFGELCCNPCSGIFFSEETDVRFGQVWLDKLGIDVI